ncbi:ArdC family protein [uncultured Algoriphagus sp.]|uniref:ArdC family protein n=1 Tax=uncultured Algoriphagus sp. TaxID=417365 RepID=UPI0030EB8DCE|tara:strand:- start:348 stop:575 length:228 start_codon:yes stop_codon:yes gene_type:complete
MKTPTKTSSRTYGKKRAQNAVGSKYNNLQKANGSSDIYKKFTDLIIEKLEEWVIPWKQPWHEMALPANYQTRRAY